MRETRDLLHEVTELVKELEMLPEDAEALSGIRHAVDEFFLLVVVGEYNAGKSTLVNALLGEVHLESGDLPTTREVHLIKHGSVKSTHQAEEGLLHHHLPVDLLTELSIVDTPGTNSMQRREQELTERFVPRADLVLFLTTLVRPYTASEHAFLQLIRSWGKKILFAVNHVDVARDRDQVERVREYVREQVRKETAEDVPVYVIGALEALEGGELSETNEWPMLEAYLQDKLSDRNRVERKLRSPLETLRPVLSRQDHAIAERKRLVEGDRIAMERILEDVSQYESRMTAELSRYQSQIENILLQMERRGHRFLDDLVRLSNIMRLRDTDVVENRFRNEVVGETAERIEEEVNALIDWLVRENLAAWDRAHAALEERRAALREAAGQTRYVSRDYVYNREELFRNLAGPVREHLRTFDARREADRVVSAVNDAIARTFGIEALVVGLGAVLTAALTSLTIDVTGAVGGTLLVVAGLFLLPQRRARLKRELSTKVEILREELEDSIERTFRDEVHQYARQLREVFEPERDASVSRVKALGEAKERLDRLESRRTELLSRVPD